MDKFTEQLVEETAPVVAKVLGVPADLAELAVRHAFDCPEKRCPVYFFLLDRVNAATSELTGVSQPLIAETLAAHTKAAVDTVAMQRRLGLPVGYDQLRSAYDSAVAAGDLTMDYLMEQP